MPSSLDLSAALADRYRIERELGGGGMSRVFLALETALGRQVVIKTIAPELLEGMNADRFAREVQVAARLQQANIVPVLAAGDVGGVPYYTMPFVRGESLRARIAGGAPIPLADAIHVLRDVARALAYAHAEGIVHRDIKPENVLLSGGTAVVTDFGIAKAIAASRTQDGAATPSMTRTGSSLGTPAYMSPEQAAGDPNVDQRTDIYAWGLIAWELIAGAHPFADKASLQALVAAQLGETPAPLASIRAGVSPVLNDLVRRCLEKDPARRPATASELLAALDQATSDGTGPVPSSPAASPRRRMIAVGAIAALLLVAAAGFAFVRSGRSPATTTPKSLAVIPFASTSGDTSTNYLGEGIADEVTNTLSEVPGLRLAGHSAAARFAGGRSGAVEIGKSLNVDAVLDGTVRRVGDRVRVTAELSNTRDGIVIWHENYERAAKDLFAMQDEIAHAIAGQLSVTLANTGSSLARGTADLAAYDLYLKGVYLYQHRGPGIVDAIAALNEATERDSNFARAWAALSEALTVSPYYANVGAHVGAADVLPRARAAGERAVRLNPRLADAHRALGYASAEAFDWKRAESEFARAIELDSGNVEARYRLGYTLLNSGRARDARPVLQAAVVRDPLYAIARAYLGWSEVVSGDFEAGLEEERRSFRLDPTNVSTVAIMATSYNAAGMSDSAAFYARRILALSQAPSRLGTAAGALATAGQIAEAKAVVQQLEALPPTTRTRATALATAYIGFRDSLKATEALEQAAGAGEPLPTYLAPGYKGPLSPRALAAWKRFNLDPREFDGPVSRVRVP